MLWFELVFLAWLLWAGALGLWCRPSREEGAAIGADSDGSSWARLLPLFRRPATGLSPAARGQLSALRRRVGLAVFGAIVPLVLFGLLFVLRAPPAPVPAPEPVPHLAPVPVPTPPAPAPGATSKRTVSSSGMDRPLPDAAVSEKGWVTVTQEDQEAISEARTPTRLYGEAKVRPIYANEDLLGIRIMGIVPGSFWDEMGFQQGDVVLEVNGELVDDPDASVYFMNSLSREYELIVRVRGEDGHERILEHESSPAR